MILPEWARDEIERRAEEKRLAEEDRLARKAAYDEWARNYAAYTVEGRDDA